MRESMRMGWVTGDMPASKLAALNHARGGGLYV